MFTKWLEEYQRLSQKTRFLSQLAAFFIAIFSLLSLYENLRAGYFVPEYVESHWEIFSIAIIFHVLIVLFFGVRFVSLFFSSRKSFWLSQIFWLFGLMTLFAWSAYTKDSLYGFFSVSNSINSVCLGCHNVSFSNASDSLNDAGFLYFSLARFDR